MNMNEIQDAPISEVNAINDCSYRNRWKEVEYECYTLLSNGKIKAIGSMLGNKLIVRCPLCSRLSDTKSCLYIDSNGKEHIKNRGFVGERYMPCCSVSVVVHCSHEE